MNVQPQITEAELIVAIIIARRDVIECARRFSRCAAEFDGNLHCCSEYIDALWDAVDRLEVRERELNIRYPSEGMDDQ